MKKLSKLFICLIIMMLLTINASSVFAATTYMGLNAEQWNSVLKAMSDKMDGGKGNTILTDDEHYIYLRAICDAEEKYFKTDTKYKNYDSKLREMDEASKDVSIIVYLYNVDRWQSGVAKEIISSPNYTGTAKEIFESTDKRYWVKLLQEVYSNQTYSIKLTEKQKKDLDILIELKRSGYSFPTVTQIESVAYSKYFEVRSNDEDKTLNIKLFTSFDDILNKIDYIKEEIAKNPGNPGSDNPGSDNPGSDNPGSDNPGSDNPGSDNPGSDNPGSSRPGGSNGKPIVIGGTDDDDKIITIDPDEFSPVISDSDPGKATDIVGKIVGAINIIGTVIAVITIMVVGVKYMFASIEQKAEYKKTMWPMLVGAILIFGITWIINLIYDIVPKTI